MKFSLGLLLLAVAMAGSALAGSFTWKGDDAGVWSEPANWEPAGVPGCGDIAYFTRDVTITSDFSVTAGAAAQLVLSNDTGTALTLDCSVRRRPRSAGSKLSTCRHWRMRCRRSSPKPPA